MDEIGHRIRSARKAKEWTLEALASASGLSSGFLSQVERDLTSLSIVSLSAICRALEVSIESMVSSSRPMAEPPSVITRAQQQLHLRIGGSAISYRYLSSQLPDSAIQELLIAEFPAGCQQLHDAHPGQELGYVLRGKLLLLVDETQHWLEPGDSYRISAQQPHGYKTAETTEAAVLMAVTERFVDLTSGSRSPLQEKERSP